jgi:hypothetical protein
MVVAACRLEDISDTSDPKTNEWLNEAKRLLRITLKKQAESLASRCRGVLSLLSQTTAIANIEGGAPTLTPRKQRGAAVTPPATASIDH